MTLTMPKNEGGNFEQAPTGNHLATCVRIIDLGTQKIVWEGVAKYQRKVMLSWELPQEMREDGTPFLISKRYTLSSHEKSTLRKDLEAWRGRKFQDSDFGPGGFVIKKVLGVSCMIQIVESDKGYSNVSSVGSLPKGMGAQEPINEPVYFSLDADEFDANVFSSLSQKLQETIGESPEYQDVSGGRQGGGKRPVSAEKDGPDEADDNPF